MLNFLLRYLTPSHVRISVSPGHLYSAWSLAIIMAVAMAGRAAAMEPLPRVSLREITVSNGLKAVLAPQGRASVATLEVWYHVGSKNEAPGMSGFAHLFEHLMFDGTVDVGRGVFSRDIVSTGGVDNAYTTVDATVFWETVPSSTLPLALWLEADRMRNLSITRRAFETERQVVEDERRYRLESQPYGNVIEKLYQTAFKVSPYRHLPIGSVKDLNRARLNEVRQFHDTYYVPNNATLVVTGDFPPARTEALIRKYFGPLRRSAQPIPRQIPQEPPQTHERKVQLHEDVALPAFVMGFHIPADGTPDSYPLRLLADILSQGESSLLYRELVYRKQMALESQAEANLTEDPNLFLIFAVMNRGATVAQGEAAVRAILRQLKSRPVSQATLEKAERQMVFHWARERETSRGEAEQLGYDAVILNDPNAINTAMTRLLAVTPREIQSVARKYFVRRNLTVIEVDPSR